MQRITLFLVLALAAAVAQAQDVPKRKSGLWEVTRTTTRTDVRLDGKSKVMQYCIDQQSDNALRQLAEGMRNESCKIDKQSRDGDKLVVDAVCKLGTTGSTAKTHAVVTGKFDSAYKIESHSTFQPAMLGKSEGNAVLTAKWLGPCKADQKPGDVILDNGRKLRVSEDTGDDPKAKHKHESEKSGAPATKSSPPAKSSTPATTK
jgi:hypothetical protein